METILLFFDLYKEDDWVVLAKEGASSVLKVTMEFADLEVLEAEKLELTEDWELESVWREDREEREEIVEALDFLYVLLYLLFANVYLNWGILWKLFLCTCYIICKCKLLCMSW